MNKKEWLIWLLTVVLIVLAATLPINMWFPGWHYARLTFFELLRRWWMDLFTSIEWWPKLVMA